MEERSSRSIADNKVYDNVIIRGGTMTWPRIRARILSNWKRLVWLAALVAAGLATYSYVSSPQKVEVAVVKTVQTSETLGATGKVRGERDTNLGLDVPGIVRQTYVKDGDRVKAGDVLLSVDGSELQAGVDIASAALSSAEAELARVSKPPLASEVRQAKAELEQAESVGRARIAQAQARLRNLQSGARSQEVAAAEAELTRRKAILAEAQDNYERTKRLVEQGAVARVQLESAKTEVETARASVEAQRQTVSLLKAGGKPEQIAEARAAVAEAQASHRTSVAAASARLSTLQSQPRPEDVRAAQAKVEQARAEYRKATQVRAKTDVKAPFDGVVADLLVERGQSISPGQTLVVFQELSKPVIEVETDEDNLGTLTIGQKAVVSSDAYPDRTFEAVLYDLGSNVNSERGTILIKLKPTTQVDWLRPDLTVDVNIVTREHAKRIILPVDSITRVNGKTSVLAIRNGVTVPVAVETGAAGPKGVVVTGNLREGEMVARNASKVDPGSDVRPVRGA